MPSREESSSHASIYVASAGVAQRLQSAANDQAVQEAIFDRDVRQVSFK